VKKTEERISELKRLRSGSPEAAESVLKKALQDKSNLVIAEAAKIIGELQRTNLLPELLAAFARLFEEPVKSDPKCWGKTAIIKALIALDHGDSAAFLRAAGHVQMEPVYGGLEDSAVHLRANGILALVQCVDLTRGDILRRVVDALAQTADTFGGIDIVVNNASAINLSGSTEMEMKRFDLIQSINMRGTFLTSRSAIPYLRKAANPHILSLSPPLDLRPEWFAQHLPYTMSKYGMSMVMLGMAEEFRADGIACNALWPRTTIATAAVEFSLGGEEMMRTSRRPEIMADAAYAIFNRPSREFTGHFTIDDAVLQEEGVTDFSGYRHDPAQELTVDIFVDPADPHPEGGVLLPSS